MPHGTASALAAPFLEAAKAGIHARCTAFPGFFFDCVNIPRIVCAAIL